MARALTWDEADAYLYGYAWRQQEALAGHRMVATRIHNLFPGDGGPLTEAQYHWLSLIDEPAPEAAAAVPRETPEAFAARIAERNRAFLTQLAAQPT